MWFVFQEFYTSIYEKGCDTLNESASVADNGDFVWQQTSDLHTTLLVHYHRIRLRQAGSLITGKGKSKSRALVQFLAWYTNHFKVLRHGSHSLTCKEHRACLYLVSVHQMAPPLIDVAKI